MVNWRVKGGGGRISGIKNLSASTQLRVLFLFLRAFARQAGRKDKIPGRKAGQ
jgi:hypothetical protein